MSLFCIAFLPISLSLFRASFCFFNFNFASSMSLLNYISSTLLFYVLRSSVSSLCLERSLISCQIFPSALLPILTRVDPRLSFCLMASLIRYFQLKFFFLALLSQLSCVLVYHFLFLTVFCSNLPFLSFSLFSCFFTCQVIFPFALCILFNYLRLSWLLVTLNFNYFFSFPTCCLH